MSRNTLGLFGARRFAPKPVAPSRDDRFAGLTPVERAMAEAMMRQAGAAQSA